MTIETQLYQDAVEHARTISFAEWLALPKLVKDTYSYACLMVGDLAMFNYLECIPDLMPIKLPPDDPRVVRFPQ